MKLLIRIVLALIVVGSIVTVILSSKSSRQNNDNGTKSIVLSILPLKGLASDLFSDDFSIHVLVPPGSSPETYEPTPQQLIEVSKAEWVFTTGLIDFEHELISKAAQTAENKVVNLSEGITLLSGCCGGSIHSHHNHGVDPHIWTSPQQLKIIAANMCEPIIKVTPEKADKYKDALKKLNAKLDSLDAYIRESISNAGINGFFIYHPALTYYADDYGINQVSIEHEGKEPSAEQLKGLIQIARRDGIDKILYQKEFSRSVVETIAKDIGAEPVEIDPLAEDILESILFVTNQICGSERE